MLLDAFQYLWVWSVFIWMFRCVGPWPVARCLPQHRQTQGDLTSFDISWHVEKRSACGSPLVHGGCHFYCIMSLLGFRCFKCLWVWSVFIWMFGCVGPRPVAWCLPQHRQTQALDILRYFLTCREKKCLWLYSRALLLPLAWCLLLLLDVFCIFEYDQCSFECFAV